MNIMSRLRFLGILFTVLSVFSLLTIQVSAQDGEDVPLGSVSRSVRYGQCPVGRMCANASQTLSGGGTGIITSGVIWYTLRVDGTGKTEVQSTIYTWTLSSRSKLYKNHVLHADSGTNTKSSAGANDSISSTATYINLPAGAYWSNEAFGTISNSLMTWNTSVIAGVQL